MTPSGTNVPDKPDNPTRFNPRADPNLSIRSRAAKTPYWLLWLTGVLAIVLSAIAFVLWGVNGASTLFDLIVALCT